MARLLWSWRWAWGDQRHSSSRACWASTGTTNLLNFSWFTSPAYFPWPLPSSAGLVRLRSAQWSRMEPRQACSACSYGVVWASLWSVAWSTFGNHQARLHLCFICASFVLQPRNVLPFQGFGCYIFSSFPPLCNSHHLLLPNSLALKVVEHDKRVYDAVWNAHLNRDDELV